MSDELLQNIRSVAFNIKKIRWLFEHARLIIDMSNNLTQT